MDTFELACLKTLAENRWIEADVLAQLPFLSVSNRIHDADSRRTTFEADAGAPRIVPSDAVMAIVLDLAHVSQPVEVHFSIRDGLIRELAVDHPASGWPASPLILGLSAYPEP